MIGSTNAVKLANTFDLTITANGINVAQEGILTSYLINDKGNIIKQKDINVSSSQKDYFWTFSNIKAGNYTLKDKISDQIRSKPITVLNNTIVTSPITFISASLKIIYPPNTKWYITNGIETLVPEENNSGSHTFTMETQGVWSIYYQGSYWTSVNVFKSGESYSCCIGYLYYQGNENPSITGGWEINNVTNLIKGDNSITLGKTTGSNNQKTSYAVTTNQKIDLSNYNTIFLHVVKQKNSHLTNTTTTLSTISDVPIMTSLIDESNEANKEYLDMKYQLDISNIDGKYQLQVATANKTTTSYYFYIEFDQIWVV